MLIVGAEPKFLYRFFFAEGNKLFKGETNELRKKKYQKKWKLAFDVPFPSQTNYEKYSPLLFKYKTSSLEKGLIINV